MPTKNKNTLSLNTLQQVLGVPVKSPKDSMIFYSRVFVNPVFVGCSSRELGLVAVFALAGFFLRSPSHGLRCDLLDHNFVPDETPPETRSRGGDMESRELWELLGWPGARGPWDQHHTEEFYHDGVPGVWSMCQTQSDTFGLQHSHPTQLVLSGRHYAWQLVHGRADGQDLGEKRGHRQGCAVRCARDAPTHQKHFAWPVERDLCDRSSEAAVFPRADISWFASLRTSAPAHQDCQAPPGDSLGDPRKQQLGRMVYLYIYIEIYTYLYYILMYVEVSCGSDMISIDIMYDCHGLYASTIIYM